MDWATYYDDLNIPSTWENTSWGNDELPSFVSDEDQNKGYLIWVDSHNIDIRADHSSFIYGLKDELAPRFHVMLHYFSYEPLLVSDNFDEVVKWINDNPKTEQQIQETKENN